MMTFVLALTIAAGSPCVAPADSDEQAPGLGVIVALPLASLAGAVVGGSLVALAAYLAPVENFYITTAVGAVGGTVTFALLDGAGLALLLPSTAIQRAHPSSIWNLTELP